MRSVVGLESAKTSQPGLVPGGRRLHRHAADIAVLAWRGFDLQVVAAPFIELAERGDVDLFLLGLDDDGLDSMGGATAATA